MYVNESELIVVFLCDAYRQKEWCGLEWRAIRELINKKLSDDRILFIKCGDGKVDGVFGTIDGYIDSSKIGVPDIVKDIMIRYDEVSNCKRCYPHAGDKDYSDQKRKDKQNLRNTILEIQRMQVLSTSAMPWMASDSVSYDYIIPSLIVNTTLTLKKHGLKKCTFNDFMQTEQHGNLIITGEAGVGKSTLLSCMFLNMSEHDSDDLYFFIDARSFYEYNSEDLLDFLLKELGIYKKMSYDFVDERLYVFIDGLDEVDNNTLSKILEIIYKNRIKYKFIVACRDYVFVNQVACNRCWNSMFQEVVNVEKWNLELSNEYVKKYLSAIGKGEYIEQIVRNVERDKSFEEMYANPFQLNILIYLFVKKSEEIKNKEIANLYLLYENFIQTIFDNELIRNTTDCQYEDFTEKMISIAKHIFSDQTNSLVKHLEFSFEEILGHGIDIQRESIYSILLVIDRNGKIIKFRHETLYEFFIAKSFILILQTKSFDSLLREFNNFYDYYINKFIRSGFEAYKKNNRIFYQSLCCVYYSCIKKNIRLNKKFKKIVKDFSPKYMKNCKALFNNSKKNIYIRELAIYYIGRLVLEKTPKLLMFAYKYDTNYVIKRIAVLGLILNNDEKAEKEYLDSLIPGSREDITQRSLTLVYFGDDVGDIYTYKDNNIISWEKSKCAIINRLQIDNRRNYLYRYWDLRTLYLFCYSRKSCDLISDEDFEIIKQTNINSHLYSEAKKRYISEEKEKLIQFIKKLRKNRIDSGK